MTSNQRRRAQVSAGLFVAALTVGGAANAQPAETRSAARRLLLDQAQEAANAGDHARAIEFAQRAGRIEMTTSVRMFLAREYRAVNDFARAFGAADLCVRESERESNAERRAGLSSGCQALRAELRARIGSITLQVPQPVPAGLEVRIDDEPFDSELFGIAYPVNPGAHVVTATTRGGAVQRREVTLAAGGNVAVPLEFAAEDPAPRATAVALAPPPRAQQPPIAQGSRTDGPPGMGARLAGPLLVSGVGVAGLVSGAILFALRQGALSGCVVEADAVLCDDLTRHDANNQEFARSMGLGATIALPVGAVALGAGLIWTTVVLARGAHTRALDEPRGAMARPFVAPGFLGLAGRF